jgi:hypothetical protein
MERHYYSNAMKICCFCCKHILVCLCTIKYTVFPLLVAGATIFSAKQTGNEDAYSSPGRDRISSAAPRTTQYAPTSRELASSRSVPVVYISCVGAQGLGLGQVLFAVARENALAHAHCVNATTT